MRHRFVETNSTGGCQYKYQLELPKGSSTFDLPHYFDSLNKDVMCWVNPYKHFGSGWADVSGHVCKVHVLTAGWWNILIFGDRKDPFAEEEFAETGNEFEEDDGP